MDLLIIGNGFDLAHGLRTSYRNFLEYCQNYSVQGPVSEDEGSNEEFAAFLRDNIWLKYFLRLTERRADSRTWIDFEKEIAHIVKYMEGQYPVIGQKLLHGSPDDAVCCEIMVESGIGDFEEFISPFAKREEWDEYVVTEKEVVDKESFISFVYKHLKEFTRAFEIYCLKINATPIPEPKASFERKEQIEKAKNDAQFYARLAWDASGYIGRKNDVEKYTQQRANAERILEKLSAGIKPVDYLGLSRFSYVLSFNYTNTYERLYGNAQTQYCYIHGKAQADKDKSNIIIGVDDELTDGKESRDFQCVRFKKYYQRIILRTGAEYKDWLHAIKENACVHIIGHSLDRTDYDILYEFFDDPRFRIIVYYRDPADYEKKVQKVIKLLAYKGANGRDELIRRVHGRGWSIKFVDQYDETEGLLLRPNTSN